MSEEREAPVAPGERVRAVAAIEILLRILSKAKDCFPEDDLETIVVYLTVAAASAGRHLRDPAQVGRLDDAPLPADLHRPTSGRAVALSSGIPRETVRRRIAALVAEGRLAQDERGVRTLSGTINQGRNLEFARFLMRELSGASARLARF